MTAAWLLMLAMTQSPPAAAPLTLAQVKVGDYVRYAVAGGTLELRACAKGVDTVTVAVSLKATDHHPHPKTLLDGALLTLSTHPLSPPVMLEGGVSANGMSGPGYDLHDCDVWHGPPVTDAVQRTVRCSGREIILGGGFVLEEHDFLVPPGRWYRGLSAAGSDRSPCPRWPRAQVDGWMRTLEVVDGKRKVVDEQFTAGSVWVRIRTRTYSPADAGPLQVRGRTYARRTQDESEDVTLAELLMGAAERVLAVDQSGSAGERTVGKRQMHVSEIAEDGESESWPALDEMVDAPLSARLRAVVHHESDGDRHELLDWGLGAKK